MNQLQRQETRNLELPGYEQKSRFNHLVRYIRQNSPKNQAYEKKSSFLKRSTTDFAIRSNNNKSNKSTKYQKVNNENDSQDTERKMSKSSKDILASVGGGPLNQSYHKKKTNDVFKVLQTGMFSDKDGALVTEDISCITQEKKSQMDQSKFSSKSAALLSINQKRKIEKKNSFSPAKRLRKKSSNSFMSGHKEIINEKKVSAKDQGLSPLLRRQQPFSKSKSMFPRKRNPESRLKAMTIDELKAYVMSSQHEFKERAQTNQLEKSIISQKVQKLKESKKDDDSDNIESEDCEENKHLFKHMATEEKQEHLEHLWKKAFIKAKAGAEVLRFFNDLSRKIYLFGVSKQLEEIEIAERPAWYILMPHHRIKTYWTIVNALMLLYTATYMPYKSAFIDDTSQGQFVLDWVIDSLFMLDMVMNFFTAQIENDGTIVKTLKRIAIKYIKSWFILDFVACFPFQILEQDIPGQSNSEYQKLLRLLRLPRLYRFLNFMKYLKQIKALEDNKKVQRFINKMNMNAAIFRMFQGIITTITLTHLFGCFFFLSARLNEFSPETWVYRKQLVGEDPNIQYLYALYWSTQTVITVGYGDIPSKTSSEMLLSLIWMLFGVAFYSFIIGNYSSIITSSSQVQASIEMKVKSLSELTKKADIPFSLSRKIKNFIENNYESIYNQDDEAQLTKMLPPSLRDEILNNTFGDVVMQIKFFQEWNEPDFLWRILSLLRPIKLEKGDILYWRGDHAEDIYFIMKGTIKLYTEKGYPFIKYQDGEMFGDSDALLNLPRDGKAIATTHLKLQVLKFDNSFQKKFFENQQHRWLQMLFQARQKRDLHLKLVQQANKKAKYKQKQMGSNAGSKKTFNDIIEENKMIKKKTLALQKSLFGSIKAKLGATYKNSRNELDELKYSTIGTDLKDTKMISMPSANRNREQPSMMVDQNINFEENSKILKNSTITPQTGHFQNYLNTNTLQNPGHYRARSSDVNTLMAFKDQELRSGRKEFGISNPTSPVRIDSKEPNINAAFNDVSPLNMQLITQDSRESIIHKRILEIPTQNNVMKKSMEVLNNRGSSMQLAIPEISYRNQKRMSILDQILSTAFKKQKLSEIYEKYPFLAKITSDEDPNRDPVMVPHYVKQVRTPNRSLNTSRVEKTPRRSLDESIYVARPQLNYSKILEPLTPKIRGYTPGLTKDRTFQVEDDEGISRAASTLTIDYQYKQPTSVRGSSPEKSKFSKFRKQKPEVDMSIQNNFDESIEMPDLRLQTSSNDLQSLEGSDLALPQITLDTNGSREFPKIIIQAKQESSNDLKSELHIPILKLERDGSNGSQAIQSPTVQFYQQIQTSNTNTLQLPSAQLSPSGQNQNNMVIIENDRKKNRRKSSRREKKSLTTKKEKEATKPRTSSMRVVAPRPSFSIMRRNSKASTKNPNQHVFVSPLSLQRIYTDQVQTRNNNFKLNQFNTGATLSPMNKHHTITSNANPIRENSLSEKISKVFEQKRSSKKISNVGLLLKHQREDSMNQQNQEMEFSNVVGKLNFNQLQREQMEKEQQLDEMILRNQIEEEIKETYDNEQNLEGNEKQSLINELRDQIFEEIKKKVQPLQHYQTDNQSPSRNLAMQKIFTVPTAHQSSKTFEPIVKDEEIEFYGDPAMVGLVQFNADMSHIALNIFETFTFFDLQNKANSLMFENIQLIESQNSITERRQDQIFNKLDVIEQQLLRIQQIKQIPKPQINQNIPKLAINQEMRY